MIVTLAVSAARQAPKSLVGSGLRAPLLSGSRSTGRLLAGAPTGGPIAAEAGVSGEVGGRHTAGSEGLIRFIPATGVKTPAYHLNHPSDAVVKSANELFQGL